MRTFLYKRTHIGDPNAEGEFGVSDCMGRCRDWRFDAVIGIGGIGSEPQRYGIDGKLNWIGIGPTKRTSSEEWTVVTFERFQLFDADGDDFRTLAPILAKRMYSRNAPRYMMNFNEDEQAEVDRILALLPMKPAADKAGVPAKSRRKPCRMRWVRNEDG